MRNDDTRTPDTPAPEPVRAPIPEPVCLDCGSAFCSGCNGVSLFRRGDDEWEGPAPHVWWD